jgi:hypothetical protein
MAHRSILEYVDELLRGITDHDIPFGGNLFLGIGCFHQVAPVVRYAGKTETVNASIVSCPVWNTFIRFRLHKPIHNASDPKYPEWVEDIGQGVVGLDETNIPLDMIEDVEDIDEAEQFLFHPETLADPSNCIWNFFLNPF